LSFHTAWVNCRRFPVDGAVSAVRLEADVVKPTSHVGAGPKTDMILAAI
jgi:hypothetical protein